MISAASGLPEWLAFDALTRTFSGTPSNTDVGNVDVAVVVADSSDSVTEAFRITVQPGDPDTGPLGNVDGDEDFDANDSFLIHLVFLGGTNAQIDLLKGTSGLSAARIRAIIAALTTADVDGDGDTDANDSFLIHLVNLGGTDAQIDTLKGAGTRTAAQIRTNVSALAGRSSASANQQSAPLLEADSGTFLSVTTPTCSKSVRLFAAETENTHAYPTAPSEEFQSEKDAVIAEFRQWIDHV